MIGCIIVTTDHEILREAPPRITSFLVKVASRCNLDCDYCYVYHHADQNWRTMPKLLSLEHRQAFARRLAEYIRQVRLTHCVVVFHGGEPLLAGADFLASFASEIRDATTAKVDFGLQTNGTLLNESALDSLESVDIAVSLSLDGPRNVNDKHRITHKGQSSFNKTLEALQRLKQRPKLFAGVIAVIDPFTLPDELFAFFSEHQVPKLDFLLPDAHHFRPPVGRDIDPSLYERWLIRAFDTWIDHFPHLAVRTFESLLDTITGLSSSTDAFGLGDVSLLSIETDGSYHDLDVLKITHGGATKLAGTVMDTPIADVAASVPIAVHRSLLQKEGLCHKCQECSIVDICGGGSLPHRFGPKGFEHPTIYCHEMLALVGHVRKRLKGLLAKPSPGECLTTLGDFDPDAFDRAEYAYSITHELRDRVHEVDRREFLEVLERIDASDKNVQSCLDAIAELSLEAQTELATRPGAIAWRQAMAAQLDGRLIHSVDGVPICAHGSYLSYLLSETRSDLDFQVGESDPWLRIPFGGAILFEDEETTNRARILVDEALSIIERWQPALLKEMRHLSHVIQFVRDPLADQEKIVSFSDNSVPGALYVSVVQGTSLINPYYLADSLVHEHRHQKLYLLEKWFPTVEPTSMLVASPWRDDLRPPSGLLHAVFVFVELRRFWAFVHDQGPTHLRNRAANQIHETEERLSEAFTTLASCPLTRIGRNLVTVLHNTMKSKSSRQSV